MTNQNQAVQTDAIDDWRSDERVASLHENPSDGVEQQYRANAYGMLAALLRSTPDQALLQQVAGFISVESSASELSVAMRMLGLAASARESDSIDDEYHALFVGLGRGELMPYGSWYLTGFLMEKPLGRLRDDLAELGFQRSTDVHEPEDHVAALCEVMLMLISDGADLDQQSHFFNAHMAPWCERFFTDLSEAKSAVFYRAVGRFGVAFIGLEKRYQAMQV